MKGRVGRVLYVYFYYSNHFGSEFVASVGYKKSHSNRNIQFPKELAGSNFTLMQCWCSSMVSHSLPSTAELLCPRRVV